MSLERHGAVGAGRWGRIAALLLLFGLAAAVRLHDWGAPPSTIAERQYRSALLARKLYLEATDAPEWRRTVIGTSVARKFALEPPMLELAVSRLYLLRGGEALWIPRALSALFWLVGGVFLLRLAERFATPTVAWLVVAYYLLVSYGVHVGASFLPDPLMIMLFLATLLAIVRYHEEPTPRRLAAASLVAGAAILVKPLCLLGILGAFLALTIGERRRGAKLPPAHAAVFVLFAVTVGTAYYLNGIFLEDYMTQQAETSFVPRVLLRPRTWARWLLAATAATGALPLLAGILGLTAMREGRLRSLAIGLWCGYLGFGLVFAYYVHIAPHYSLQLVPVVALSAIPLASAVTDRVGTPPATRLGKLGVGVAGALGLALALAEIRADFRRGGLFEPPALAAEIGEIVGHSTRVAFIAPFYGVPLEYHAELAGDPWPRPLRQRAFRDAGETRRGIAERVAGLRSPPDYFVITDLGEFRAQHEDLREFLDGSCRRAAGTEAYLVYDTRACLGRLLEAHARQ